MYLEKKININYKATLEIIIDLRKTVNYELKFKYMRVILQGVGKCQMPQGVGKCQMIEN